MILLVAVLLIFFLTLVPYHLYYSGQLHYFLYAFHHSRPDFLTRDWLITQTANPHPFFSQFIALFDSFGNLPLWLFGIRVVQFLLLIVGILRLARLFSKDLRTALLVFCFLLFYFSDGLGQSTLYSSIVQPEDLAKVFYLFSVTALLEKKILQSWVFLGLTMLFDAVTGAGGLVLLVLFLAFQGRHRDLGRILGGMALFLLLASPNLVPILKHFSLREPLESPEIFKVLFNFRGPHHYRVSTFELSHVFRVLLPTSFLLLITPQLARTKEWSRARLYAILLLLFSAAGAISVEWFYFPPLTSLRPFRLTPVLLVLGLIAVAASLLRQITEKKIFGTLLAGVTLAIFFLEKDSRLFVPLSLFLLSAWWVFARLEWKLLAFPQKCLSAAILFLVPVSLYVIRGRSRELFLDSLLSFALILILRMNPQLLFQKILSATLLLGLPLLGFQTMFPERLRLHPIRVTPPPQVMEDAPEYYQVLNWIRNHTPKEALILGPPDKGAIRFFAERATVVNFHANPYGAQEVREWKERLEAVSQSAGLEKWVPRGGNTIPQLEFLRKGYFSLSASQVEMVAQRYGADYFLTESSWAEKDAMIHRGHEIVFENSSYLVYRLRPSPS